ncbi:MAG: hypothetical protein KME29_00550 [Calothrix sp. FI2-JRJ7]|nr:hypothetical protein [Calothrix sp. FI2-JRJ7]
MTLYSSINLINPQTGQRFPSAPNNSVVLSSFQAGWRQNLTLEVQRLKPVELPEHYIEGHRLIINLGGQYVLAGAVVDVPMKQFFHQVDFVSSQMVKLMLPFGKTIG